VSAPSAALSPAGTLGANGWYTSDVTVSFSLSGSGFSNPTGCGNQTVSTDTNGTLFRCTVDLSGGSVVGAAVTIKRDATPPTPTSPTEDDELRRTARVIQVCLVVVSRR